MKIIYVMENKINHKKYVGQTNNFQVRMNGHKSDANNPNSHSYKSHLSFSIRKYGWENFNNYIVEELPEEATWQEVDLREKYFIEKFNTFDENYGYNLTSGGAGCPKKPLTYEEKLKMSKLFSPKEIKDIQQRLILGETTGSILALYEPRLTRSYLDNINRGDNFKNEEWDYPLRKKEEIKSLRFSPKEIKSIKEDIKSGMIYNEISKKWNITIGLISGINNGTVWTDTSENYPLIIKSHSRLHNLKTWVVPLQEELMNGNLPMTELAKKYDKAYSTVKKINSGASHRNPKYKYPLTSNRT